MLQIAREARLAALDDCKTLLERVLTETLGPYDIGSSFVILRAINKALAELEALKTSLPKEVLSRTADDKK